MLPPYSNTHNSHPRPHPRLSSSARFCTSAASFCQDVRSPSEYEKGHIPGAHSLPLFTDKQREKVGITYKSNGKEAAIRTGLKIVDESYAGLVAIVERVAGPPPADVYVYCWRGGMRSGSASTLLQELGYNTHCLKGGYKAFRGWSHDIFLSRPLELVVLRGRTGTGKTDMLMELRANHGAQVLDLEGEANHRGSNFGHLHTAEKQPTHEIYHNQLAILWAGFDQSKPVFVEDESSSVGNTHIPNELYQNKEAARLAILMTMDFDARIRRLLVDYGESAAEDLIKCVARLKKRLGPQETKRYIDAIENNDIGHAAAIVTRFYDTKYDKFKARPAANEAGSFLETIHFTGDDVRPGAEEVLALAAKLQAHAAASPLLPAGAGPAAAAAAPGSAKQGGGDEGPSAGASSSSSSSRNTTGGGSSSRSGSGDESAASKSWAEENRNVVIGSAVAVAIAAYLIWKKQ